MSVSKLESLSVGDLGEFYEVLDELKDYAGYFIHRMEKLDSGDADNFAFNVDNALRAFHVLSVQGRDLLLDYSHVALAFHDECQRNIGERRDSKYPRKGEMITVTSSRLSKKLAKVGEVIEDDFNANLKIQVEAQKARQKEDDLIALDNAQTEHSGDEGEAGFGSKHPVMSDITVVGSIATNPIVLD